MPSSLSTRYGPSGTTGCCSPSPISRSRTFTRGRITIRREIPGPINFCPSHPFPSSRSRALTWTRFISWWRGSIPGINGGNPVKYVERMTSRNFLTDGVADVTKAWFVDCGLQYSGAPGDGDFGPRSFERRNRVDSGGRKRSAAAGGNEREHHAASMRHRS